MFVLVTAAVNDISEYNLTLPEVAKSLATLI